MTGEPAQVYTAEMEEAAVAALHAFEQAWGERYPMAARAWRSRWENVVSFFGYLEPGLRGIYTSSAIESLNAQPWKLTRKRGAFSVLKAVRMASCAWRSCGRQKGGTSRSRRTGQRL